MSTDPIAWAADRGYQPAHVASPHFVIGFVQQALKTAPMLSKELRDALLLIEAHVAMRSHRERP
jgi:hypothetical protein